MKFMRNFHENSNLSDECSSASKSTKEDRYGFDETDHNENIDSNRADIECLKYFEDGRKDLEMLHSYLTVLKIFRRFNTILPSSAPVERLFSYGGLIMRNTRTSMRDDLFEALAMFKCCNI